MSAYGGGPPPGWQDPYGGGYGGNPYGSGNPYGPGTQPSGFAYGPPGVPARPRTSGSTTAALVCNIVGVVLCCGVLSIPGAITAAIAQSRVESDPESARKLTIAAWVMFGLSIVLGIVIFIVYIVAIVLSEPSYDSTSGV